MPDSKLAKVVRLVHDALILVSVGHSERSSIATAALSNPDLGREKPPALALVVDVVSKLDWLDRAIQSSFPNVKFNREKLALFRLTAHLILIDNTYSRSDVVWALRRIAEDPQRSQLEQLLGFLIAWSVPRVPSDISDAEQVGLRTHNPPWWVSYCFYIFGRGIGLKILSSPPRPRYIRVNPLRNRGRTSLPLEFRKHSSHLAECDRGVYILKGQISVLAKHFETGLFQAQDYASFLAVKSAEPAPGEDVLDLCAAPGGKTATLAQLMKNRGRIISVDYSENRMESWNRETERLGVKNASPLIGDASNLGLNKEFDLVIVDPPCTGTGILDRNPRMKWHLTPRLVQKFSLLQSRMLEESSKYTRLGGRILYCTCSLTLEENEMVVSRFLNRHPDFETRPILKDRGSPGLRGLNDCRRLYPYRDGTAGYFIARLERAVQE